MATRYLKSRARLLPSLLLIVFLRVACLTQDLEPRAFSRAPVGTQNIVVSYGYQSGDVFTDTSLPLSDVTVSLNSGSMGYAHTFGLFGKQANVAASAPYVYGHVRGRVFD